MKIKTVAVLGAGAVGSYVIWGLSRRKDIRLGVLAEGKRAEKLISDEIGASHVIYSVIKVASHKEENGYCFNPETTIGIIFGEPCAPYDSERVQAIEALFADTGLHSLDMEVPFPHQPDIPHCRIWMRDAIRRLICSQARWSAWGGNLGFLRRIMNIPTI